MYIPDHFAVTGQAEMQAFVRAHPFGQLISTEAGRPLSSHLPFLLNDEGRLVTHLARANRQWRTIADQEVLVSFVGPHAYISPSWYTTPGVPTWNYQAVHVYGRARVITDGDALAGIVESMTREQEKAADRPWSPAYREGLLQAVVGLDIEISEWQGKYKLGQNRSADDCRQVAAMLRRQGDEAIAEAMCRSRDDRT